MSKTYTARFGGVITDGLTEQHLFTADGSYAYVVRDIVLGNPTATAARIIVLMTSGSGRYSLIDQVLESEAASHLELRQRMENGDQLHVYAVSPGLSALVTGYQLEL